MQPELQIYLAGTCTFGVAKDQIQHRKLYDWEKAIVDQVRHRLESYHYVHTDRKVREMRHAGVKIFLDSGAFSAHTLGKEINLKEYCRYIHENQDLIRVEDGVQMIATLDSIGDADKTYENLIEMQRQGVRSIPTFHMGEDERYLDWYVANYEYISLGGLVGANPKQLVIWLDRMFSKHILDGAGRPKTRVHGFGITSIPIMERYPWYSCDSSSWIQTTSHGGITIPGYGNLDISAESPNRHNAGQHLRTMTPADQWKIWHVIKQQGFDPQLVSRYDGRVTYNIWAYSKIEDMINEKKRSMPAKPLVQELF